MGSSNKRIFAALSVLCFFLGLTVLREAVMERTGLFLLGLLFNPMIWKLFYKKRAIILTALFVCAAGSLFLVEYSGETNSWRINWDAVPLIPEDKPAVNVTEAVLNVHYIDIGQGDATLITCNGQAMLIDAGENDKGTEVQLYLKKQGIEKLDYVIATHPDSDHIGGLDVILTKFDCGMIIMPDISKETVTYRDVMQAVSYRNQSITRPVVGQSYPFGDGEFTIVAPSGQYGKDYNNWSVGIILTHGSNRFMFAGDAETEAEHDIANSGLDISCDVYKVDHHGSDTSSTKEFLDAVNPEYAVISCGLDNDYGHPHKNVLNRLEKRNIEVFRTDIQGSIVAESNGTSITWSVENE